MINACGELELGRLEGIVGRKVNVQEVYATSIWAFCWSHDSSLPLKQVIAYGSCAAVRGRIPLQVRQFLQTTKFGIQLTLTASLAAPRLHRVKAVCAAEVLDRIKEKKIHHRLPPHLFHRRIAF